MTTYRITKDEAGFLLLHLGGPYKIGLDRIRAEDQTELVNVFRMLRVPEEHQTAALEEVRTHGAATIEFDARVMEPL